jgi:hypothetical protein
MYMHKILKRLPDCPFLYWEILSLRAWIASSFSTQVKTAPIKPHTFPFLLIVGSGRSGNTLLRRLMMERLDIYIPPETYVLPKIADYRIRARGLKWPSLVDLVISAFEYHPEFETFNVTDLRDYALKAKGWGKEEQTINKLIIGLYSWWAAEAGFPSTWLGDKTPLNTLHLGPISRIIPKAKYIYLLRDGADVSSSYVQSGIYQIIEEAGRRWVQSQKAWNYFKKRLSENEYIEVRYEELAATPEKIVQGIKAKFEIPERHQKENIADLLGDVPARTHHANVMQAISTDSVGKGRRKLTESQKIKLRPVINSMLTQLRYDPL